MTRPCWLRRAVRNRHSHAIEQCRVDGVAVDAAIQDERAVNLISTQVMAGSESDARNNGLLFFGGWAAISVVARNAGLMSGQYAVPCLAWNAACAAYSVLA